MGGRSGDLCYSPCERVPFYLGVGVCVCVVNYEGESCQVLERWAGGFWVLGLVDARATVGSMGHSQVGW